MTGKILYVYAIGRNIDLDDLKTDLEGIDGRSCIEEVAADGLSAAVTPVMEDEFGPAAVENHSGDLEWLGTIGVRHDAVVTALSRLTTIIPLRAFTLFGSAERLKEMLHQDRRTLEKTLQRLDGKEEWTVGIEFEPIAWNSALTRRIESLRALADELQSASPGRSYLLTRKLEAERKTAARDAEQTLVSDLERSFAERLAAPVVTETRQMRDGSFPQINMLLPRGAEPKLKDVLLDLQSDLSGDGVTLRLTGPWPPYTFSRGEVDE